jgi:hypothetical protein
MRLSYIPLLVLSILAVHILHVKGSYASEAIYSQTGREDTYSADTYESRPSIQFVTTTSSAQTNTRETELPLQHSSGSDSDSSFDQDATPRSYYQI